DVTLEYVASATLGTTQGSGSITETVPAGQQVVFADILAYLRSRGLAIPTNLNSQGGTILVTPDGGSAQVVATARTTTATAAPLPVGAAGLAYGGIPIDRGITEKATIFGLRSTADDRSNVAVYNTSANPVTVKVTVISGQGDGKSAVIAAG